MATYHIDFVNGNDSNDGSDWANAWLTIDTGATSARTAPGDLIKIAKTADPVSTGINATFTDGSATVTLASALTKNIQDAVSAGDWTTSANISASGTTNRKFGSTSVQFTPAAGFTTGKVAYAAVSGGGTQDFSSYSKIAFWFRPGTSTVITDSTYKICLCSDATGDTIVNEIFIPATIASNSWRPFVLDYGGALGSSIQSVAIYAPSIDPGATPFGINNIIACNDVHFNTLIGLSGDVNYNIQSIDGTTIKIDSNNTSASGQGYSGTGGTATLYYQVPFIPTDGTGTWATMKESGTSDLPIVYSGGWNTSTNLQDGYTVVANLTVGSRFGMSVLAYTSLDTFKFCRFGTTLSMGNNTITITNVYALGCNYLATSASVTNVFYDGVRIYNCSSSSYGYPATYKDCVFANNSSYGQGLGSGINYLSCTFRNNSNGSFTVLSSYANYRAPNVVLRNCNLLDSTVINLGSSALQNVWVTSFDTDGVAGSHDMWTYWSAAEWQTSVVHDTEPGAWHLTSQNSGITAGLPNKFPLPGVMCNAGSAVTYSVWVKKSHATSAQCYLMVENEEYNLAGITAATDVKADDTNWEELSVTFTPTEKGGVPLFLYYYQTASGTYDYYVGKVTITQA